jgi:sirohydrochlorin cobaltochelatase
MRRHRLLRLSLSAVLVLTSAALFSGTARADEGVAVLVLAEPGSAPWVKSIKTAVKQAEMPCPYRIYFGLGDSAKGVRQLQSQISALESSGAHTIVVIPLLVSSYSGVGRQWKYLLGVDVQPGFIANPVFPVTKRSSIRYMEPLNDSAVVVEILLDRAQELSSDPSEEHVVIIARGPRDDSDNALWIQILSNICKRLKERGNFRTVEGFTLRDEAPSAKRLAALQSLRSRISAIEQSGRRAIVVSLLLAPGGIEHKLGLELRGLSYALNTKTLLPDSRLSEWIRSQVP